MAKENLWAPWRIKYIQGLSVKNDCFICHNMKNPAEDEQNFVLWRTAHSIVMFNKFPYNNGHLLIAPARHIADMSEATDEELMEIVKLIRDSQKVLTMAIAPHGFNVGMNFGRCAGAGLPGHIHVHVVPRWDGDTNFMSVCSDTDVISQGFAELLGKLKEISGKNNLPSMQK